MYEKSDLNTGSLQNSPPLSLPQKFAHLHQQALRGLDSQSHADCFVPLRASWHANSSSDFDLETEIYNFLESDKKVLLLLGDSGSGKSLTTQRLVTKLWENYKTGSFMPLWISLATLKNPLHRLMPEYLSKAGFSEEAIAELQKNQQFLLILDGYDEIHQYQNLYVTNYLERWLVKVIFTCRQEYLYGVDNYTLWFKPFAQERAQPHLYTEMVVKPFTTEQINSYLRQVVSKEDCEWKDWQQYRQAINEIPDLENFLTKPFLLKMAVEALPQLVNQYRGQPKDQRIQMTQASVYDICVRHWFERQEAKLKQAGKITEDEDIKPAFWSYAKALARAMHSAQITVVHYEEEDDPFSDPEENPWSAFFAVSQALPNSDGERLGLLRTACLVREVESHQYAFIHSSLLDYFLTQGLYDAVKVPELEQKLTPEKTGEKEKEVEAKPSKTTSSQQEYFNQQLLVKESNNIQFLADRVTGGDEDYQAWLFAQIDASKNNPERKIAAANAITILNRAKVSLSGKDFRGIQIPYAELSYVFMSGSDLTRADLTGVSFHQAYLAYSDMSQACLNKVNFGQYPMLQHKHKINALSYSPDSKNIVTGAGEAITLWDTVNGQKLAVWKGHTSPIGTVAFSPDGQHVASGSWNKVHLWDATNGQVVKILDKHTKPVTAVAFTSDGLQLASGSNDSTACLWAWSATSGNIVRTFGERSLECVNTIALSPDRRLLATGSNDVMIRLWDTASGQLLQTLRDTHGVHTLAFSPDGRQLASGGADNTVQLWDVTSEKKLRTFRGHTNWISSVAFSPDGRLLVSGSSDKSVNLWDATSGELLQTLSGHTGSINAVAFSPDGRQVASGSNDETVRLWDVESSIALPKPSKYINDDEKPHAVAFSPNGRYLVSNRHLHDVTNSCVLNSVSGFRAAAFSPDGQQLALASDLHTINLWETTGRRLQTLNGHTRPITAVVFSSDGQQVASGSVDGTLCLWDAASGRLLHTLKKHAHRVTAVTFSLDGQQLASGSEDKTVGLWDTVSGQRLRTLKGHTERITAVTFSPDGQQVASASDDKTVHLWNTANGRKLQKLSGHTEDVTAVAFSPDGQKFISGDKAGMVRLWDTIKYNCLAVFPHGDKVCALYWHSTNNQFFLVDYNCQIYTWQLPQTIHERYTLLKAPDTWSLTCLGLKIEKTLLSPTNKTLLQQLGAVGKLVDSTEQISKLSLWRNKKEIELSSHSLQPADTNKKVTSEPNQSSDSPSSDQATQKNKSLSSFFRRKKDKKKEKLKNDSKASSSKSQTTTFAAKNT
jgi:WD40 repeat protein